MKFPHYVPLFLILCILLFFIASHHVPQNSPLRPSFIMPQVGMYASLSVLTIVSAVNVIPNPNFKFLDLVGRNPD